MSARRAAIAAVAAIAAFTMSAAPASAGVDRKAPSKPTNLRLTAKTTTTISIAWDAAKDNSGKLSYEMHLWRDPRVPVLPQTQTSFTWTELRPGVEYYVSVAAVDAAGNRTYSDLLIVQTPRDTIAPSAPPTNLHVDSVTASQVALSWDPATDESAIASYAVFTPSGQIVDWAPGTSRKVIGLPPNREFTFYVKARDHGGNVSAPSNTVTTKTLPSNDTTPPSAPNLWVWDVDGCEVLAEWSASSDNESEPAEIRYLLFVNDEPNPTEVVIGITRTVAYGSTTGPNTFVLKAIDAAGNVTTSNPVTLDLFCRG
jgi:chitodextrinase